MSHEINKQELDDYLTREPDPPSSFYEELYPDEPHCFHQASCPVLIEVLVKAERYHQCKIEEAKREERERAITEVLEPALEEIKEVERALKAGELNE